MGRIEELNQEVNRLKRKLEDEQRFSLDKMEELVESKKAHLDLMKKTKEDFSRKLRELEDEEETEVDILKVKVMKQDQILCEAADKIECPVCLEIPRSGPVPVCPNGHFVCKKCKADSCPTCRVNMGEGKSLLAVTILENIEHSCMFEDCDEKFPLAHIEKHEEVCLCRLVNCLRKSCKVIVSLSDLADHLFKSAKCSYQKEMIMLSVTNEDWISRTCTIREEIQGVPFVTWLPRVYSLLGEVFTVFSHKAGGQVFFCVVMLATETECSEFWVKAAVHEEGSTVSQSGIILKFEGEPVSIDWKKEDQNLFGTTQKFMNKLINKSKKKNAFNLSFKISKK